MIAYGLPVLLSGHATFLGYLRLDDTATWLDITDNIMAHGRSVSGLPSSTYTLVMSGDVGPAYPLGAFALFGVSHGLVGIDVAWIFQPYLACCGAAIALCIYALAEPLVASPPKRALVAFLAAQPALLYGYSLWGGIKELTAAFLLVLGMALAATVIAKRPERGRELLGVAICGGGLLISLSVGAGAWLAPAFAILFGAWALAAWHKRQTDKHWWRGPLISTVWLAGLTAACAVPLWAVVHSFLSNDAGLFNAGQDTATTLGNLIQPLSGYQLAGIWTIGDFRYTAPLFPTAPLVAIVFALTAATIWTTIKQRRFGLPAYVAVALLGCLIFDLAGSTPWVMGKALAIASPALLTAALIGATTLWGRRVFGLVLVIVLAFGVIASNLSGFHDVLLAPKDRLAELQRIGGLVAGTGPTFVNDYEVYADRHFDRAGAPVEPAEYREADLPTSDGVLLVKTAYADLDSFSVQTLLPYRSIVVRNSPVESRPPSLWHIVWSGRYYQLYQRGAPGAADHRAHPARGSEPVPVLRRGRERLDSGAVLDRAGVDPAVHGRAKARRDRSWRGGSPRRLPAAAPDRDPWRRPPVAGGVVPRRRRAHADAVHPRHRDRAHPRRQHPAVRVLARRQLHPRLPGEGRRALDRPGEGRDLRHQRVRADGEAAPDRGRAHGRHHVSHRPTSGRRGTGNNEYTTLQAIALQPLQFPRYKMLNVAPAQASELCGRPLDWIELVAPAA